jgi:hypothetical protein
VAEMALVDPVYYTSFGRIALGQSALWIFTEIHLLPPAWKTYNISHQDWSPDQK